jgi:hypothetical protein
MDKWQIIHAYRRLFKSGLAEPWTCQQDGTVLVSRIGLDDDPVLWCMTCGEIEIPVDSAYDLMLMQLKEHDESFS